MGAEIDSLDIQIKATVDRASNAIDKLIGKLDFLSSSLGGINEKSLTGFANGISKIAGASTQLGNVKTGDFTRLSSQIGKVTTSTGRAAKATRSFSQIAGNFYANYFLAVRGLKKAWKATESSMDFLETVNYFEVAMRNIGDNAVATWDGKGHESAESYAKSFSERAKQLTTKMTGYEVDEGGNTTYAGVKNLGMNPESVMNYQAMFAQVSESIGVAEESALNFSTALTMLGADWASLRNVSFEESWGKFASALSGQSRAVRAFGIDITNATLQEYAYKYGLTEAVSEMNQATKAQLRLLAILDQSNVAYGDLANTMKSPSNQLRMLQQNFSNLARTIGNLFIPVVTTVLPYINGLVMALQRLFSWIGKVLGIEFKSTNSAIGGMDNGIEDLVGGTEDAENALSGANEAAKKLKNTVLGFDELNQLNDNDSSDSGGSGGGTSGGGGSPLLDEEIAKALADYQKSWDEAFAKMENKAQNISDRIVNAFKRGDYEGIGRYISDGITRGLEIINWQSVYKVADKFGSGFAQFLNGLITPELFGGVGMTIASALNTAVYTAFSFGKEFDWSNLGESIGSGINNFFQTFDFTALAETINVWVQGIFLALKTAISEIDWWEVYKGINDFLKNLDIPTVAIVIGALAIKKIKDIILKNGLIRSIGMLISKLMTNIPIAISSIKILKAGGLLEETGVFTKIVNAIVLTIGKAGSLKEALIAAFGAPATILAGIASIIGGAVTAVVNFFTMWQDGFSWLNEALMVLGVAITAVGAVILGVPAGIAGAVAGIVAAIATVVIVAKDNWGAIKSFFAGVAAWFDKNVITPVCEFFKGLWKSVSGFFSNLWEDIKKVWSVVSTWFSETIIEPIVGFFQSLWTRVKQIFEGLWIIVKAVWIVASEWFNKYITTPIAKLFNTLKTKVSGYFSSCWTAIKGVWDKVSKWFTDYVSTPVGKVFNTLKTAISGAFSSAWTAIKGVWDKVSTWFTTNIATPLGNVFDTVKGKITGAFDGAWSAVKLGVVGAMNSVIAAIETAINWIVSGINKIVGGFNKVVSWAAKVAKEDWGGVDEVSKVYLGRISMYAEGGFPETGQLFMARENGINEMVGSIGHRSAVANNDQIVTAVSAGVADAVANVMMAFSGQAGTEAPVVELTIKSDSETLYRTVQKGKQKHDRRYHVVTEF